MDKREVKQQQQSISESIDLESSATSSYHHHHPGDREPNSPADGSADYSPARSSVSSLSSLSNGFSPVKQESQQQQQQPQLQQQQQSPKHGFVSPQLHPLQNLPAEPPSPVPVVNRYVAEEPVAIKKTERGARDGFVRDLRSEEVVSGGGSSASKSGGRRQRAPAASGAVSRTERVGVAKKAALGFRVFEVLFCLISLSVMAADKNQGWALDSFYRYKEFRYCITVNVIGFAYSALQGCDLAYQLASGNYYTKRRGLRLYLDFSLDQMVAYLLISASSSAAMRVDDWQSNWGKDKFPEMATASVGLSFVAFVAFAFSSLISGYLLCTLNYT